MSKMKLFYTKGSCSLNPKIIIHEIGLNVEFIATDFNTKLTEQGDNYLQINPKGSVPALMLENGEILTEGAIITQYLVDTYSPNSSLLPAFGNFKRFRILEMVNHVTTDLHKSCSPIFNKNIADNIKNEIFKPIIMTRLTLINEILKKQPYLTGNDFTIADSYFFVVLSWMNYLQINISSLREITNFIEKVKLRPSVILALNE